MNTTKILEAAKHDARNEYLRMWNSGEFEWNHDKSDILGKKPVSLERVYNTFILPRIEEVFRNGIEGARSVLRSSQENCMCNEKNHLQLDRLIESLKDPQG